jgi:hypothetical protein
MELEQRVIIRFLYREGARYPDPAFGTVWECRLQLASVQRWCLYLRQEREFLNDESRSGRSPIDFLDVQILSSLEKRPFRSAYSPSEVVNVSHAMILNHLRDSLHLEYFHLRWISHQLTE